MPDEISSGGDYPQSSNVETRVSAIEMRLARVETAVDGIQKELQAIRIDLAEMRGRLTNIPTTFQIAFMLATFTVATFIGATGSALAY
jgi:uncharacterized coiled-coil protein SlyX